MDDAIVCMMGMWRRIRSIVMSMITIGVGMHIIMEISVVLRKM